MAFVITDACTGVKEGACAAMCPVDAIHPAKGEAGHAEAKQLYIDPDACISCGMCVGACPVGAIFPEDGMPEGKEVFVQINAGWFKGRE